MQFWVAIANLARRWRVMVPVLLVASTLGALVFVAVPVRYVSTATMVLATTEHGGTESRDPAAPTELTNPMLNFSDSLATTADMLIWSMTDRDVRDTLSADGTTEVLVDDGRTNPDLFGFNGPVVYVSAEGTDPAATQTAVDTARDLLRTRLLDWQRSMRAPRSTYVSLVDVVPRTDAEALTVQHVRLAAMAFAGGFVLALTLAYLATHVLERRPSSGGLSVPLRQPDPARRPVARSLSVPQPEKVAMRSPTSGRS
jgi:hypothetical protein